MNHNKSFRKLGRDTQHRIAMLKNLTRSLIQHERIETTLHRAKELRSYIEKIITQAKVNTVHSKRLVFAKLRNDDLLKKLFNEIAPKYLTRPGGYCRIMRDHVRKGDGATVAIIELV